jgi:hypothetical protein
MSEVLAMMPLLNLLLVPMLAALLRLSGQLATLTAVQAEHERRIDRQERIADNHRHERATP